MPGLSRWSPHRFSSISSPRLARPHSLSLASKLRHDAFEGAKLLVRKNGQVPLFAERCLDPLINIGLLAPLAEFLRRLLLVLAEFPEQLWNRPHTTR